MKNYLKTFFILFAVLISLILGSDLNSDVNTKILTAPISIETQIVKTNSVNESSVVQSNHSVKYFTNYNKRNYISGSVTGFSFLQKIRTGFNNNYYRIIFARNTERYLSVYLRNEICTRAP